MKYLMKSKSFAESKRYIKTYEKLRLKNLTNYEEDDWMKTSKFRIGETVVATKDYYDELKEGEKYIIEDIIYNLKYMVKGVDRYFYEDWFISEYEADAKKYNL